MGLAVEAHVAEEDDNVASHVAVGVNVAEKADGVVDGRVRGDFNVVEELNCVIFGASGRSSDRQGGAKEAKGEKSSMHRFAILATSQYTLRGT